MHKISGTCLNLPTHRVTRDLRFKINLKIAKGGKFPTLSAAHTERTPLLFDVLRHFYESEFRGQQPSKYEQISQKFYIF